MTNPEQIFQNSNNDASSDALHQQLSLEAWPAYKAQSPMPTTEAENYNQPGASKSGVKQEHSSESAQTLAANLPIVIIEQSNNRSSEVSKDRVANPVEKDDETAFAESQKALENGAKGLAAGKFNDDCKLWLEKGLGNGKDSTSWVLEKLNKELEKQGSAVKLQGFFRFDKDDKVQEGMAWLTKDGKVLGESVKLGK